MSIRSAFSLFTGVLLFFATSCNQGRDGQATIPTDVVNNPNSATGKSDPGSLPVMEFEETEHDFGRILEGESVSFGFNFTNTGKSDLIIGEVTTSCGCTVPSFPRTAIRPGEKGTIKIAFNSAGKRGYQVKNIVVVSNMQPNTTLLKIKAQVAGPGK